MDWYGFFTMLRQVGYKGPIGIEHEDRHWNKDDQELLQGLLIAQNFLQKFEY
jgi:sugar phosphate isomerase/epimerase